MPGVGLIVVNTLGATAAAILGWLVIEKLKDGKATAVGAASGAVTGLVAITPACANLNGKLSETYFAMGLAMRSTFTFCFHQRFQ
jgi:ammonia channel protein AmtB